MKKDASTSQAIDSLRVFLNKKRCRPSRQAMSGVSLFSGAGISDVGYELAGFRFCVQVEKDAARAAIGSRNFPHSTWIVRDVRGAHDEIAQAYRRKNDARLDLLVATPPCQGMSSSNPSRGKRKTPQAKVNDEKNALVLALVPIARALKPRIIVTENVRQILTHTVKQKKREVRVLDVLADQLPDYSFFETSVNIANYGIPQIRYRALVVGVHAAEDWLPTLKEKGEAPWPRLSHAEKPLDAQQPWLTLQAWLEAMCYPPLSSGSPEEARNGHPLHFVPHYDVDRYLLVSDIPPNSGRSAYENDTCPACGSNCVPPELAACPACGEPMRNRPIVLEETARRLIKGFKSSYRRMRPDRPAPTVTTNSSHIGSDNKIHPWEHRVLSILECADLQTVPWFFNWSDAFEMKRTYLIRNVIGEAFPSYFTYLHGRILRGLVRGHRSAFDGLATYASCS